MKLKQELQLANKKLAEAKSANIAAKWRITSLRSKRNRTLLPSEPFSTPIQGISRTINRLSKVTGLLEQEDLRALLKSIVHTIQEQDLFTPTPGCSDNLHPLTTAELFEELKLDPMTIEYIMGSFSKESQQTYLSHKDPSNSKRIMLQEEQQRLQVKLGKVVLTSKECSATC